MMRQGGRATENGMCIENLDMNPKYIWNVCDQIFGLQGFEPDGHPGTEDLSLVYTEGEPQQGGLHANGSKFQLHIERGIK